MIGPHFESLGRHWVNRYADSATLGAAIGSAHRVRINDPGRRRFFEMDIAAPSAEVDQPGHVMLQVVGEAKATRLDLSDLARLDRLAHLLAGRGRVSLSPTLKRMLFSLTGFAPPLIETSDQRTDVELWTSTAFTTAPDTNIPLRESPKPRRQVCGR